MVRNLIPVLTQSNSPRLWRLFQKLFDQDKQRIARACFDGQKRVLEVGCSVGNISEIFKDITCDFIGIDIDQKALKYARERFLKVSHMTFHKADLNLLDSRFGRFDLIMFNGMCHHVETKDLEVLIGSAVNLLADKGKIIVSEPIISDDQSRIERFLQRLDRGNYFRSSSQLQNILSQVSGMRIVRVDYAEIRISLLRWPLVGRYMTAHLVFK
ncbi:MAG: class I SAM-dependent methyltransferase [Pseudomonadota bacterium]|nr:class I SAM-dependent methyltransferase [Pseudomonadota bacterium]